MGLLKDLVQGNRVVQRPQSQLLGEKRIIEFADFGKESSLLGGQVSRALGLEGASPGVVRLLVLEHSLLVLHGSRVDAAERESVRNGLAETVEHVVDDQLVRQSRECAALGDEPVGIEIRA